MLKVLACAVSLQFVREEGKFPVVHLLKIQLEERIVNPEHHYVTIIYSMCFRIST